MIDKIKELEKLAKQLEPGSRERKAVRKKVIRYTEDFLDNIGELKAYVTTKKKGSALLKSPVSDLPIDIDKALQLIEENVDTPGLNPASGGHLGYIPGGGIYYSALGDYMADIANRYAGIFFASPGAVRMENMLIDWMAKLVGYPQHTAGNLASGGSIANLIAIVTARDAFSLKGKDLDRTVIYLSEHVHHCLHKAIRIAGLGECIVRHVPLDEHYRMKSDELEKLIAGDKEKGLNPWLVIASAGTTDVGAVDPLDDIAVITEKHKLWFHVDGAYGAFFILTKHGKKILKGIERSDSLVMDPHKGLFLPYGSGVVLVKNSKQMQHSHYYRANYMQDALSSVEELSPADLSPELTKHFRGLRLWLPLKLHGLKPFKAALEEKLLLARYFHSEVQKLGFEAGPAPELSVVTYRFVPSSGDANAFNEKLVQEVQKDGRVFISSTVIDGKFTLRLAVLSFRTHIKTIDLLLKVLKEKTKLLLKG
jgi:glutamate/tyrosine decarboxylase-like PLP-dependent enzyme